MNIKSDVLSSNCYTFTCLMLQTTHMYALNNSITKYHFAIMYWPSNCHFISILSIYISLTGPSWNELYYFEARKATSLLVYGRWLVIWFEFNSLPYHHYRLKQNYNHQRPFISMDNPRLTNKLHYNKCHESQSHTQIHCAAPLKLG